jgi:hypothetical protein
MKKHPIRENRIHNEAIVDAYGSRKNRPWDGIPWGTIGAFLFGHQGGIVHDGPWLSPFTLGAARGSKSVKLWLVLSLTR